MTFDPVRICEILVEEKVEFVVVGGFAAIVRGSSLPTRDIDIVPLRERKNLDRLGRALSRMNAKIRTSGDPVATRIDGAFLANMPLMVNLVTDLGELDITFSPGGVGEYPRWNDNASDEAIAVGLIVRVASLDDVITSKRSANRPKDQLALPYLESLREQITEVERDDA